MVEVELVCGEVPSVCPEGSLWRREVGEEGGFLAVDVVHRPTDQTAPLQAALTSESSSLGGRGVCAEIRSSRDALTSKWCPVLLSLLINLGFQECC